MSIITLTTDWHNNDQYLGALKGRIYSLIPEAHIIDISHQIPSFNSIQAAYLIKNCYQQYPKNTIHIIGVNSEATQKNPHLVVEYQGQYFIAADNGIFSQILDGKFDNIVKINKQTTTSFPELEIFAEIAAMLSKGIKIHDLGEPIKSYEQKTALSATFDNSGINGIIIYFDSFGNAVTNISDSEFKEVGKGRSFIIYLTSNHYHINKITKFYHETPDGELLALFNSSNLLELGFKNGNISQLLNLKMNAIIRIKFTEEEKREELLMR